MSGNNNLNLLAPVFNALGHASTTLEIVSNKLSKLFRQWSMYEAANIAERLRFVPKLKDIQAFHMPTVGTRKNSDHIAIIKQGRFVYQDPLYEYTRVFAEPSEDSKKWVVTRQKLRVYESEMEQGIGHDAGRLETFEFDDGYDAWDKANALFEEALYTPNKPETPSSQRLERQVMADHHAPNSLMYHIVGRAMALNQCPG